jgi:hypothetical protein
MIPHSDSVDVKEYLGPVIKNQDGTSIDFKSVFAFRSFRMIWVFSITGIHCTTVPGRRFFIGEIPLKLNHLKCEVEDSSGCVRNRLVETTAFELRDVDCRGDQLARAISSFGVSTRK